MFIPSSKSFPKVFTIPYHPPSTWSQYPSAASAAIHSWLPPPAPWPPSSPGSPWQRRSRWSWPPRSAPPPLRSAPRCWRAPAPGGSENPRIHRTRGGQKEVEAESEPGNFRNGEEWWRMVKRKWESWGGSNSCSRWELMVMQRCMMMSSTVHKNLQIPHTHKTAIIGAADTGPESRLFLPLLNPRDALWCYAVKHGRRTNQDGSKVCDVVCGTAFHFTSW